MFIRTKKAARNDRIYVQLVESYRENGKMKQRMIRHIGTAQTDEELQSLKEIGLTVKAELEQQESKPQISPPQGKYAHCLGHLLAITQDSKLPLSYAKERARIIVGIHDVYGFVYEQVGFTNLFSRPKQREKAAQILREIVLARIAQPASKRSSVTMLSEQFGVQLKLETVYQMMDKVDELFCERIQKQALSAALNLAGKRIKVLFYDATTLYFESFTEDDLKQNGYSKDMKFNQPQILLALFVTEKGSPVGYDVFPGKMFEGHTLLPMLEKMKQRYHLDEVVFVADRGMLSKVNLTYLRENNIHYIVGSRLKSLTKTKQAAILAWIDALDKDKIEDEKNHEIMLDDEQRLILSYRSSRAKKDKLDREKAIQKLQARLSRSKNPKQLISNYGFQKFISVNGEAELQIDEEKLQYESRWDGVVGIITNHQVLKHQEAFEQYRGLWQVEESFRISKHDLKIRPIYHWTPNRVRAHIAIAFMAFVCIRYLEYRVAAQHKKLSPEVIRKSLMAMQGSIVQDTQNKIDYLLPSTIDTTAKHIYRVLGIKIPQGVMQLKTA